MQFWLVQRLSYSPQKPPEKVTILDKLGEALGGGRFSDDFTMDYMGSAEFEFGTIPEAAKKMLERGPWETAIFEYVHPESGHISKLDFLWCQRDGDPTVAWKAWVEGGMDTKERPYELPYRLKGEVPKWIRIEPGEGWQWETALYWALNECVVWGFNEDGYIEKLIA